MGQCGITSSKTVLVFLNLIFWVSWRAARAGGGLCAARGDQAGAGASRGLARALRPRSSWWGPSGARRRPRRCRPEVWGGSPPPACWHGARLRGSPRREPAGSSVLGGLSLSGRQARNGTLPSESGPLSLSESWQSQWLSPGHVAATWGTRVESWARNFDFQLFV